MGRKPTCETLLIFSSNQNLKTLNSVLSQKFAIHNLAKFFLTGTLYSEFMVIKTPTLCTVCLLCDFFKSLCT